MTSDRPDGPVTTTEQLADLQAGRLDDETAARLRHLARTDPDVARRLAALDRVRRDVADLGVDADSAPDVPAGVTARVGTALRSLPPSARSPRTPTGRVRIVAAAAGFTAAVAAGAVGTMMLLHSRSAGPVAASSTPSTSSTVAAVPRPGGVPLSDEQLLALLERPRDLGALASPQRLASCLGGLGYPTSTAPLGARPLVVAGRQGVLLLLPGDTPNRVDAVVVAPNCSSVDTGLLASTVVIRP